MKKLLVLMLLMIAAPCYSATVALDTALLDDHGITVNTDGRLGTTGGRFVNVTTVNAATYDILITDEILHVTYTATGAITITWPTAQITRGRAVTITDGSGNAETYNITLEGESGELINGEATAEFTGDFDSIDIYCDGTNLFIR